MTFPAAARTLPIVVYGQFRTLISLLIVFALAILFLWGGSHLLNSVTGAAPPPPTPTVPAVVEQPRASPTPRPSGHKGQSHNTPTPTPVSPTPLPSPTPKGPPKVFITETSAGTSPATAFPVGLERLYCWVRTSELPAGVTYITFAWSKDVPNGFLNNVGVQRYAGTVNGSWFPFTVQTQGKYRCDVTANQQLIGTAHFSIGP